MLSNDAAQSLGESMGSNDYESSLVDNAETSSCSGTTSSTQGMKDAVGLGGREAKLVNGSKLLMYLVLLCVTASVTSVAYIFLRNEEENDMEIEVSSSVW